MKVVIAPQYFKESRSGMQVARAMERGVKNALRHASCVLVPVADGGDGTLETLIDQSGGLIVRSVVSGPLGGEVTAMWGSMGDKATAVIEMAQSSGLALLKPNERDPRLTTTRGVGELFKHALDSGHRKFIVGIGGSATNDGGAGFAQALGVRLLDEGDQELEQGGAALGNLHRIDMSGIDERLSEITVDVACDVNNPLCGTEGASAIFGPQKGAMPEVVRELDGALAHFARIIERDVKVSVAEQPGSGAAGGLGAGLMAFTAANLRSGSDIVLDVVKMEDHLIDADVVIVGEGRFDKSTVFDKAPAAVARLARKKGIPVIGIAGSLGEGYEKLHEEGISAMFSIVRRPTTLEEAMAQTDALVASATEEVFRAFALGMNYRTGSSEQAR